MKKRYCVVAAIFGFSMLVAGSVGTAHAAQQKGDSDIQMAGSFFHAQGADSGTLNVDIGYGYYLTDSWELGILQTVGYSFIDDADDQCPVQRHPQRHGNVLQVLSSRGGTGYSPALP